MRGGTGDCPTFLLTRHSSPAAAWCYCDAGFHISGTEVVGTQFEVGVGGHDVDDTFAQHTDVSGKMYFISLTV